MGIIRIDKNPSRKSLRVFGACWLAFFGMTGAGIFLKDGFSPIAVVLWVLAVTVPLIGGFRPSFLRAVYVGMSFAAYPVGMAVSFLLLAIVFYLVITPVGFIMKLLGHDPLKRKFEPNMKSYWIERGEEKRSEDFFRQF